MMSSVIRSTPGTGTRFSQRYELKYQAGIGGMGTVYQAIDRQSGVPIALKILHSRKAVEQARFEQEARVLAELSHPGIVRYFDHGETPDGALYIAMEWLEGETLEDRVGRGSLDPGSAAHVARLVLEALSAAHARHIVHRDIKPGNIFLVGGKVGDIRVLDFGIARRVFDAKRLTRKGSTVGTPLYTSPEQARGRADVDGRADIFSLGCVLFEALTGEPPFMGETPLEVMTKVCAGLVPEVTSRRAGIPPALASLVHEMLSPDPDRRPQSAAALAGEFAKVAGAIGGNSGKAVATGSPSHAKHDVISDSEEQLTSAMLVSLGKRQVAWEPGRHQAESRGTRKLASASAPGPDGSAQHGEDARLAAIRCLLAVHACEMDRLINRTLLLTAPTVSTAHEQAIQLASAALALRDLEPNAKIAIATGRASFHGRLPVGRLMDCLPALMEGLEAGAIRIDETTRQLLPARFVADGQDELNLQRETEAPAAEWTCEPRRRKSPFLAREREIAFLQSALEESRAEKSARLVLLLGAPGLGKTRLVCEFLARIPGAQPHVVQASGSLLRTGQRHPALSPVLDAAGIDAQGASSEQVEEALAAWLAGCCSAAGIVLVLDDLQWVDLPSLELLERVLRRLPDLPIMVVGAGREEVEVKFPGLWRTRSVRRLRLRPLPPRQGSNLLRFWIPSPSRANEEFILERWEGSPQFLEQMAASATGDTIVVPEAIHAVVEGRFEGVEPDARRVLRAASLFGEKPFSVESLIALLGEPARKGIAEWLEVLVMRDLIEREVKAGEASYRFRARLVRDTAYQMLTAADRALARRLARAWLEGAGLPLPEFMTIPTPPATVQRALGR